MLNTDLQTIMQEIEENLVINAVHNCQIFSSGKEVDLDAMAEQYKKVGSKTEAGKLAVEKNMDKFIHEINQLLQDRGVWKYAKKGTDAWGMYLSLMFFAVMVVFFAGVYLLSAYDANLSIYLSCASLIGIFALFAYLLYVKFLGVEIPKGMEDEWAKWDPFYRAVKSSRMKEYPPASAVIWGKILVYATALGVADKVNAHLSEIDAFIAKKVEKVNMVREHSLLFYSSAYGVRNLAKYGNKFGPSRTGGFSSGSSGGWSSGGGGFGGGSSGGGGFR